MQSYSLEDFGGSVTSTLPLVSREDGAGEWYYSIQEVQLKDLLGQLLTQLEASGMDTGQLTANKSIVRRLVHTWFEDVKDNCRTASIKQLTPFVIGFDARTEEFEVTYKEDYDNEQRAASEAEEQEMDKEPSN